MFFDDGCKERVNVISETTKRVIDILKIFVFLMAHRKVCQTPEILSFFVYCFHSTINISSVVSIRNLIPAVIATSSTNEKTFRQITKKIEKSELFDTRLSAISAISTVSNLKESTQNIIPDRLLSLPSVIHSFYLFIYCPVLSTSSFCQVSSP